MEKVDCVLHKRVRFMKYILVRLAREPKSVLVVRASRRNHASIFNEFITNNAIPHVLVNPNLLDTFKPSKVILGLAGGLLNYDARAKTLTLSGQSFAFGRADHKVAIELLQEKFPDHKIEAGHY